MLIPQIMHVYSPVQPPVNWAPFIQTLPSTDPHWSHKRVLTPLSRDGGQRPQPSIKPPGSSMIHVIKTQFVWAYYLIIYGFDHLILKQSTSFCYQISIYSPMSFDAGDYALCIDHFHISIQLSPPNRFRHDDFNSPVYFTTTIWVDTFCKKPMHAFCKRNSEYSKTMTKWKIYP